MKYKILVVGNNTSIINDLFLHKNYSLDYFTSTLKYDDMRNHIRLVSPDLFLFCMAEDSGKSNAAGAVSNIRVDFLRSEIPFAIVCDSPEKEQKIIDLPGGEPNLSMYRPITATEINRTILEYLNALHKEKKEASDKAHTLASAKTNASMIADILPENTADLLAFVDAELNQLDNPKTAEREKKRILVIDDAPNMLKIIKNFLDRKYEVATAVSGKLGFRFLSKKDVDLILLDYEMPEEDGPTVLQELRSQPKYKNIPVIFLTGINDVDKIQKALSLKPQGYLLKPIDQGELLTRIESLIG